MKNKLPKPENLRRMTQEAIERGEELRKKKLLEIEEANERKKIEDESFAKEVLSQIPEKCEKQAAAGGSCCVVMMLKHGRDYNSISLSKLEVSQLKGPALIVLNTLRDSQLKPTIEHWHDGIGFDSGFNIVVHW